MYELQPHSVAKAAGEPLTEKTLHTGMGAIIGTPEYISPEEGLGEAASARSDLYSMGVILFHLLTRRVPFHESSAIETVLKHINAEPPHPRKLAPHADARLSRVCLDAMEKDPKQRYGSAREMLADLRGETPP